MKQVPQIATLAKYLWLNVTQNDDGSPLLGAWWLAPLAILGAFVAVIRELFF